MIFLSNMELLFYKANPLKKNNSFENHSHSFWQTEIINKGKAQALIGKKSLILNSKDIAFIPPKTVHGFKYIEDSEVINMSFNFQHDINLDEDDLKFDKVFSDEHICSFLWQYPKDKNFITETETLVLKHLLAGLFSVYYDKQNSQHFPKVFTQALEYIQKNQKRYMKVGEVAAHVNSSAGYLSALFRKYKNMSLKKFFDSSRMEYIRKYLAYSDLTMTEIAESSGFEDVYSFSRFVKTQTGLAPLKLRNKLEREKSGK